MATAPDKPEYQTRYDEIAWDDILADVTASLDFLRLAWRASERGASPEIHAKMVKDLYVPCLRLLAEFSACIEAADEEPNDEGS
jgi:hypothetical protein